MPREEKLPTRIGAAALLLSGQFIAGWRERASYIDQKSYSDRILQTHHPVNRLVGFLFLGTAPVNGHKAEREQLKLTILEGHPEAA